MRTSLNKDVQSTEVGYWCLSRIFHLEKLAYNQIIIVSAAQDQVLVARSCKFNYRTYLPVLSLVLVLLPIDKSI